jgi:hypothetical protein
MKGFVFLTLILLGVRLCGQGTIVFDNRVPPDIDAPVFDSRCLMPLAGTNYLAQVYVGFTPMSLKPWGQVTYFRLGGYVAKALYGQVEGAGNGQIIYVQLRAWEASAGSTYEEAVALGGKYGYSNLVGMPAYIPPGPPTFPFGLQSFCLVSGPSPRLSAAVAGPGSVLLSWAVPTDGFLLQQNSGLVRSNWLTVTNAISVTGTNNQFKVPASGAGMFYRLSHP